LSISWQQSEPSPALVVHPPGAVSLDEAHAAIEQWEHYSGKTLDGAQRLAVELMMAETAEGRWAARSTGRAESRQNGKGDELEVVEAWDLTQRAAPVVHSAHEIPTAKSAHQRLVAHLESHRDLRRLVSKIRYANGDQAIEMVNGGVIVYRTRTAGGGRGLDDIARLVVDEAQHAQPEQLASANPILSANPNPQTNFTGSAGILEKSNFWWALRKRALKALAGGDAGQFSWLEHSAEVVSLSRDGRVLSESPDPADEQAWRKANPAFGIRIERDFFAEELGVLGPHLFAREHLCVWDPCPDEEGGFLPFDTWADLSVTDPTVRDVCFGVSVAPDGQFAAVASAGRLPSGELYVDNVKYEPGTAWLVDDVVDRWERKKVPPRLNPAAPEGSFIRELTERGVEVIEVTGREYQQACGEVLDSIKNRSIAHLGQEPLDRAVRSAQRRDVGKEGGWVWAEPASGVDISALKAATLALSGVSAPEDRSAVNNVW
jgi:hypothetical protein